MLNNLDCFSKHLYVSAWFCRCRAMGIRFPLTSKLNRPSAMSSGKSTGRCRMNSCCATFLLRRCFSDGLPRGSVYAASGKEWRGAQLPGAEWPRTTKTRRRGVECHRRESTSTLLRPRFAPRPRDHPGFRICSPEKRTPRYRCPRRQILWTVALS